MSEKLWCLSDMSELILSMSGELLNMYVFMLFENVTLPIASLQSSLMWTIPDPVICLTVSGLVPHFWFNSCDSLLGMV